MTRRKTRSEIAMATHLEQLDPESPRYQVLVAAKRFKASWVELGACLTQVREERVYESWGYADFETYCRRELHIKRDTANKLTRSYAFVRDHEPAVLDQEASAQELPALDVVDLLTRARERSRVSDAQFDEIRRDVFADGEAPSSRAAVVRRFREIDPDAFRTQRQQSNASPKEGPAQLKKALLLAERLEAVLTEIEVSPETRRASTAVVKALRGIFDDLPHRGDAEKSA